MQEKPQDEREHIMKKKAKSEEKDELRPEYDFSKMKGGVRGKYVNRYKAGTNLILLAPDVAKAFPNEEAVNEALRLLVRRNAVLLIGSMMITFIILRIYLHWLPNTDLNIGQYNIHHLFTGLILMTIGGIPLAIFRGASRKMDAALVIFGTGLGMALDEWVFLIATDGTNASYLLPVSLWGGIVVIGLACVYALGLVGYRLVRDRTARRINQH